MAQEVDVRSPELAYSTKDNIAIPATHNLSAAEVAKLAGDRDADNKRHKNEVVTHTPKTDTVQRQYVPIKAPN